MTKNIYIEDSPLGGKIYTVNGHSILLDIETVKALTKDEITIKKNLAQPPYDWMIDIRHPSEPCRRIRLADWIGLGFKVPKARPSRLGAYFPANPCDPNDYRRISLKSGFILNQAIAQYPESAEIQLTDKGFTALNPVTGKRTPPHSTPEQAYYDVVTAEVAETRHRLAYLLEKQRKVRLSFQFAEAKANAWKIRANEYLSSDSPRTS